MPQVRIGLIGCGGFAGVHARRLNANPDCEIVALYDTDQHRLSAFLSAHFSDRTQPKTHDSTDSFFARSNLEAVVISSPHAYHFEQGKLALQNNCHVLMEKPMVVGASEARELGAIVRDSGKVFVVGYNTPCTEPIQRAREIVRSGELGKLECVSAWLAQDWMRATKGTWRQSMVLSGGGQMLDSGAHLFASIVFCIDRPFVSAFADTDNVGCEVEINGTASIRFQDDVLASVMISGNSAVDGAGLVLLFEHGRIELDGWGGSWMKTYRRGNSEVESFAPENRKTPDDNFITAILGREEPIAGVELGERLAVLMDSLYKSAKNLSPATP
jgi:predicted dehydrogenase